MEDSLQTWLQQGQVCKLRGIHAVLLFANNRSNMDNSSMQSARPCFFSLYVGWSNHRKHTFYHGVDAYRLSVEFKYLKKKVEQKTQPCYFFIYGRTRGSSAPPFVSSLFSDWLKRSLRPAGGHFYWLTVPAFCFYPECTAEPTSIKTKWKKKKESNVKRTTGFRLFWFTLKTQI